MEPDGAGGTPGTRVGRRDQLVFDWLRRLEGARASGPPTVRPLASAGLRALRPIARHLTARDAVVRSTVWGQSLLMRADHHLPRILAGCPSFGEPLALLVRILPRAPVRLVDVGANIGDTVALLEAATPGKCRFLCIEPHPEFARLLRLNTAGNPRVRVAESYIADVEGLPVQSHAHTPGKAASRLVSEAAAALATGPTPRTRVLDEVARDFADEQGGIDVLKVDTDGFDFKVLRSARALLARHRPLVFFELHPALWLEAGEDPAGVFAFLHEAGYRRVVFFTNRGIVHAQAEAPSPVLVRTLIDLSLARRHVDDFHFDVLAGDATRCEQVVAASLARFGEASR